MRRSDPAAQPAGPSPTATTAGRPATVGQVTLLTGDRVVVGKGGTVRVTPGPGRPFDQATPADRQGLVKYVAQFPAPAGASVSLRAKVVDGDGNRTEQTVTDAIRFS